MGKGHSQPVPGVPIAPLPLPRLSNSQLLGKAAPPNQSIKLLLCAYLKFLYPRLTYYVDSLLSSQSLMTTYLYCADRETETQREGTHSSEHEQDLRFPWLEGTLKRKCQRDNAILSSAGKRVGEGS